MDRGSSCDQAKGIPRLGSINGIRLPSPLISRPPDIAPDVFALRDPSFVGAPQALPSTDALELDARERLHGKESLATTDDVLTKDDFLRQLRREKLRAERSGTSLSIALLEFQGAPDDADAAVHALVPPVLRVKRETDTVGAIGRCSIAVLLPDTDEAGMRQFMQRITGCAGALAFTSKSGTYPHDLLDSILAGALQSRNTNPLLLDELYRRPTWTGRMKRAVDVVGALVGITVLSPIMLLAAVAIRLTSPGPVIFRQVRVGRWGVRFVFYKFRSMYRDADERIHREYVTSLISGDKAEGGEPRQPKTWSKLTADPRITPVGRFLRRTSIDELPQLFNVLKGDLSLVGPRPALPYEVEKYQPWHLQRVLAAKPGISGSWQVSSRGRSTFDEMVRMDVRYARSWSLKQDFKIMAKTVMVVVRRSGAG
jgi:lipopolysaccharide/colanic/teichoic acid biosynthesis glycosyltransferase